MPGVTCSKLRAVGAAAAFAGSVVFGGARPALAGGALGAQGGPIQTSAYHLDLFQGPILASSRVTAMGGAYSALAEGAEGIPFNAAAASQRYPYSTSRTDYDLTASVTSPASVDRTDFDNNGHVGFGYRNFVFYTLGALLQRDHFGIGSVISLQNYSLGTPQQFAAIDSSGVKDLTVRIFKIDAVVSYGFLDDELNIGGGLRGAIFNAVDSSASGSLLLGTYGAGLQGGALWRPRALPLRLGATVRSPVLGSIDAAPHVTTDLASGDRRLGRFYLPQGVDLPWEVEWGVAAQIGRRPLNLPWTDEDTLVGSEVEEERRIDPGSRTEEPHLEPRYQAAHRLLRRKYRATPRDKLLVSFSMLFTGRTPGAVGVESMLTQTVDRSGEKPSLTMRGGAEMEVLPNRFQLRVGSYLEPTRFRESTSRVHGTTGFEVKLLEWSVFGIFPEDNVFRVSGAVDAAREYFGWSLGFGSWY